MANYVVLGSFTDQGIRNVKGTAERAKAFRGVAGGMGVQVKAIYWTLGQHDIVITLEAKDDETVTALLLKVGALGNVRSTTLRAFDEKEISALLAKV